MNRSDIRHYFGREEAAFPTPSGLRAEVVGEAERSDSDRGRGGRVAAVVAAFVAVAVAAGLVAVGTLERNQSPIVPAGKPSPTASGKPIASEAHQVTEIDFVDSSTGFALLCTIPGGQGNCQYWISRTTDAGGHWSLPVKVGPRVTGGDSGHHIHFANGHDGVMYGNSSAYVTHDGGRTWAALNLNFLEIVSISGASLIWMVMDPCAKGVACSFEVLASSDGARTWSVVSSLPAGFSPASVASFGSQGLLISTFGTGDMLISRDGAKSWTLIKGQCPADTQSNVVATADGNGLWQICVPVPPPVVTTGVWRAAAHASGDGGLTWWVAASIAPSWNLQFAEFADGVVIESDQAGLIVSRNGGQTWTQVGFLQGYSVLSLSWLPDGEAWVADATGGIWMTRDHGASWSRLPAQLPEPS